MKNYKKKKQSGYQFNYTNPDKRCKGDNISVNHFNFVVVKIPRIISNIIAVRRKVKK